MKIDRIHPEILADIVAFCPEGFTSVSNVSKPLELARQSCLINLIRKIERENLHLFPFLKGFSDFGVEKAPYRSTLISEVFKKIVGDLNLIVRANAPEPSSYKPFSMDKFHNLLVSRDLCRILKNFGEVKKILEENGLIKVTNVLRREPHNLLIPQGRLERETWFNNEQNQEQLLAINHLFLREQGLRWLPGEIRNLRNLQYLDLHKNHLIVLPEWIGSLENLKILDLSDNYLTALPESMRNLTNLKRLDLKDNQLRALPEWTRNSNVLIENRYRKNPEIIKYTAIAAIACFAYTFLTLQTITYLYSNKKENLTLFLLKSSMIVIAASFFERKIDQLFRISNDMKYFDLAEMVASVASCFLFYAIYPPNRTSV